MESLEKLTKECIQLLESNQLLKPLVKSELVKNIISKIALEKEIKDKTINEYTERIGLKDEESFEKWLKENKINKEEFENLALKNVKLQKYCNQNFSHQVEARFLTRKHELDIVVYSLIRVDDFFMARELYFRILEKEADFGEIATKYSTGIENKSRGIVGPTSISKTHPQLAELLRNSKPGEVQILQIDANFIVTRLESLEKAHLDTFMKGKMEEELFNSWLEKEATELSQEMLEKSKQNSVLSDKP